MRPWLFLRFFTVVAVSVFFVVTAIAGCGRTSLEPEDFLLVDGGTSSSSGGPTSCGPTNCSTGCCSADGKCMTGNDATECGSLGGTCSNCTATGFTACNSARACVKAVATCNASTCPDGCCQSDGSGGFQCAQGTSISSCGTGGEACVDCENSGTACDVTQQHCSTAKCDASNCTGCCVGDQCLPGNESFACGANGGQCGSCDAGEVCQLTSNGGGQCIGTFTCGPANCGGCCNPDGSCVAGIVDLACGVGGALCQDCQDFGESCTQPGDPLGQGTCQPMVTTCDANSCPNGCCEGTACVPFDAGTNLCGQPGTQCTACAATEKCDTTTFTCQAACNAATCAGGCCVNDICAVGTQNTACGTGGAQCTNCTNLGDVCTANACVTTAPKCTAANCANGCCQNDTCVAGISNDACGTGGVACTSCTATNAFCDGLVTPRACSDKQTTCPAPYGSCGAGVATPVQATAQNVCTTQELQAAKVACADPTSNLCQQAIAVAGACGTCISAFAHPFSENTGLYACAASTIGAGCRHSTGCATDCASTSCSQCAATATSQCYTLVNSNQCNLEASQAASCTDTALAAGQFCSQFSYADFGTWLQAVGTHFCGAGP